MNFKKNPVTLHSCMFCKKSKFKKLGNIEKTQMVFGVCKNCKLTQTYIRWLDKDFQAYYSSGEYLNKLSDSKDPNKWHFDYAMQFRKHTIHEIKKHITTKEKILEFGCSVGALVYMLKDYNVLGVDIDTNAIKFGKSKNINVEKIDIFKTTRKFDVIYSSHVFEHLSDPHKYIDRLRSLLNTNGKLIIAVPSFLTSGEWGNIPHLVYYQFYTLQNFFVGKKWKINNVNYFNRPKTKFPRIFKFLLSQNYTELILVASKIKDKNSETFKRSNYYYPLIKFKIFKLLKKVSGLIFKQRNEK